MPYSWQVKCLICKRPVSAWPVTEQCQCMGSRCNLCKQLYIGIAGDCSCSGITDEEYGSFQKVEGV